MFYERMLLFRAGGESPHSFHSYLFRARSFQMQWIQRYMWQIGLYPLEGDTVSLLVGTFAVWLHFVHSLISLDNDSWRRALWTPIYGWRIGGSEQLSHSAKTLLLASTLFWFSFQLSDFSSCFPVLIHTKTIWVPTVGQNIFWLLGIQQWTRQIETLLSWREINNF